MANGQNSNASAAPAVPEITAAPEQKLLPRPVAAIEAAKQLDHDDVATLNDRFHHEAAAKLAEANISLPEQPGQRAE